MKTQNKVILSAFLLAGILGLSANTGAIAATSASQTLTATLGAMKKVTTNGGTIASTINPDDGTLQTAFTPGFRIETNTAVAQNLDLYGTCQGATSQQAFYNRAGVRYIVLANTTVPPTDAAIADCKVATPTDTSNANAISYAVTEPADIGGQLDYTWNGTDRWTAALTHKGKTDTSLTIPSALPFAGTYSGDDEAGSYVAVVTLAFNP